MKQPKSKKNKWNDFYGRKAEKENFPARSVYKLKEIDEKYRLIKKGDKVLDLGCFPGSWLIYASGLTGNKGEVVGIDLKPVKITLPSHVLIYTKDIFLLENEFFSNNRFNIVMSDMAPDTTGNKHVNSTMSFNLSMAALSIAQKVLLPGGSFVCKVFQGEDFNHFTDQIKKEFKTIKIFKPKSSRKASREIYIIGFSKKTGGQDVRT